MKMILIIELISYTAVTALFASWIISLLTKWKIIERCQVHAPKLISEMCRCNFCLSWWACVVITVPAVIATGNLWLCVIPVLATNITKKII
jgi:hypothetical protein